MLALLAPVLVSLFRLDGIAADVLTFYCRFIAFSYAFFGLHLAATQTFTNIGHPAYATYTNIFRDLVLTVPLVALGGLAASPYAIITGQYMATLISGSTAFFIAYRMVHRAAICGEIVRQDYHRPVTPYAPSRGH